eukprot:m.423953 g.423953  ORF g.423953 m.423953 type:complete len:412 (-) comp21335_c0_seq4:1280-2515(-)
MLHEMSRSSVFACTGTVSPRPPFSFAMPEAPCTRDAAPGTRNGVVAYTHNSRLFTAAEPPCQKPPREADPRGLAHESILGSASTISNQHIRPRRRTLPKAPGSKPAGPTRSKEVRREFLKSARGIIGDERTKAPASLSQESYQTHASDTTRRIYEGTYVPSSTRPKSFSDAKIRGKTTTIDQAEWPQKSLEYVRMQARPPWMGMDGSSLVGVSPAVYDVDAGAQHTIVAAKVNCNFVGTLRSGEVVTAPPRKPSKPTRRETGGSSVFDRLTDPRRYGARHRNRFDVTTGKGKGLAGTKDDTTLNLINAGQGVILRDTDIVAPPVDDHEQQKADKTRSGTDAICRRSKKTLTAKDQEALFERLSGADDHKPALSEFDVTTKVKSRWGANHDAVFAWQSGESYNAANIPRTSS